LPPEREEKGPFEEEREEEEDLRRAMEIVNFTVYSRSCQREEGARAKRAETWRRGDLEKRKLGEEETWRRGEGETP
jgi:hypothetical protein